MGSFSGETYNQALDNLASKIYEADNPYSDMWDSLGQHSALKGEYRKLAKLVSTYMSLVTPYERAVLCDV